MADEKLTAIKRRLARCTAAELNEITKYIRKRGKLLGQRASEKRAAEAWERAKQWYKRGKVIQEHIWVCMAGTMLGGRFQRGDKLRVLQLQPRKKILWVEFKGKEYWFAPAAIARYDLRAEPPEEGPLSATERHFATRIGKLMEKHLQ
jgi:hypothetical protein